LIHISGTSALVLLWGGKDSYKSQLAKKYMENIDLSAGTELYENCSAVWEHYHEIIKNRKFGVFNFLESILSQDEIYQVIVLAAGIAPLSLDIHEKFPSIKIFDTDIENMDTKKKLYERIAGQEISDKIKFIHTDITNQTDFKKTLIENGWDENGKSIIIAEGISYYLTEDELWNTFAIFKSNDKSNYIILESRLPYEKVSDEMKDIQEKVWVYLKETLNLNHVTRYFDEKVTDYCNKLDAEILQKHTMKEIEMMRYGRNELFHKHNSGWIEIRKIKM